MIQTIGSTEVSLVIPLYNEASNLEVLFGRLDDLFQTLKVTYEIICVNDGSQDQTLNLIVAYHHRNPRVKVINLSRNFGKDIALTAGIDYSTGHAVIPMDADLQDPPELVGDMLMKWREGYDVVYAVRLSRQGESWLKRLSAGLFYRVMGRMSNVNIPHDTGDFRLLDRRVVEILKQMPERTRFMKGLFSWVGFKQTAIFYDREQRYQGQTKWNYWRLWNFALDGITSFSLLPLKVWSYIGLLLSSGAFLYALYLVIRTVVLGVDVPGYASLMVAVLSLGGIQILTLGILGEYLGRVYEEVKRRPLYLVRDAYGFEDQPSARRYPHREMG